MFKCTEFRDRVSEVDVSVFLLDTKPVLSCIRERDSRIQEAVALNGVEHGDGGNAVALSETSGRRERKWYDMIILGRRNDSLSFAMGEWRQMGW